MNGFFDIKLQLGCLLIISYIYFVYYRETRKAANAELPHNKIFGFILGVSPWAVVFDGASALTIDYRAAIPEWVNLICHIGFFVFVNLTVIGVFVYIVDMTIGIPQKWSHRLLMFLPGIISFIVIFAFIGQLEYVDGDLTSYSVGVSPTACFVSAAFHYLLACVLMFIKRRYITKHKQICVFAFAIIVLAVIALQMSNPQILFTSVVPAALVLGIYDNFEDPSRLKLKNYNERMVTNFATLVENRDDNTGGHIQRTREYVSLILDEMKKSEKYKDTLTVDFIDRVKNAAPMHDIGKISTPDYILQKPGALEPEERKVMQEHTVIGAEIILKTFRNLNDPEYLKIAYNVAKYHHEKWNGKGYPEGLKGEEIPICARIMAVADVFDAVSADRVYRKAMPLEKCYKIIEEGAGEDFDPEIARLFLNAREQVTKLYFSSNVNSHTSL